VLVKLIENDNMVVAQRHPFRHMWQSDNSVLLILRRYSNGQKVFVQSPVHTKILLF
jgi:hypothetical protein